MDEKMNERDDVEVRASDAQPDRKNGGRVSQSGFCCQISIVTLSNPQKS